MLYSTKEIRVHLIVTVGAGEIGAVNDAAQLHVGTEVERGVSAVGATVAPRLHQRLGALFAEDAARTMLTGHCADCHVSADRTDHQLSGETHFAR